MTQRAYKYLFGPVASRRVGRSLGIDLVPFKTCTYDCIYCQLGRTTCQTVERKVYVPPAAVLEEIARLLEEDPVIDYFTIAGSGEPTLHQALGEVIAGVKSLGSSPVAVLTNGSLLHDPAVCAALMQADVVMPTVVSTNPETYRRIHRPYPSLTLDQVWQGLRAFRESFPGEVWVEVFFVAGLNDSEDEVKKTAGLLAEISPTRVQLNTAVRVPAEEFSYTVSEERLIHLAQLFTPPAEVIPTSLSGRQGPGLKVSAEQVLAALKRRPMTAQEVAQSLGLHINEVNKLIHSLVEDEQLRGRMWQGKIFYEARSS